MRFKGVKIVYACFRDDISETFRTWAKLETEKNMLQEGKTFRLWGTPRNKAGKYFYFRDIYFVDVSISYRLHMFSKIVTCSFVAKFVFKKPHYSLR